MSGSKAVAYLEPGKVDDRRRPRPAARRHDALGCLKNVSKIAASGWERIATAVWLIRCPIGGLSSDSTNANGEMIPAMIMKDARACFASSNRSARERIISRVRPREVTITSRSARGRAPTARRFDFDLMRRASVSALAASGIVPRESSREGGTGRERDV